MKIVHSSINAPTALYIPNGLQVGKQLVLKGRVSAGAQSFAINLQENERYNEGAVAFHFNPRLNIQTVVRNSLQGGWGPEERDQPNFPFENGKTFVLCIEVTRDEYRTYVNGKAFINYRHRLNMNDVHYMFLSDGVEYDEAVFQDRYSLPYSTEIPGNMRVGKAIKLKGAAQNNQGFSVNFARDKDAESIAFHFNPRPNEGVVVRNAKLGGWGAEERDYEADFPFKPLQFFDAMFVAAEDKFLVYVNGEYFADFKYRTSVDDVSHLVIRGSFDIMELDYLEPVADDFVKMIPSGLEKGNVIFVRGFMKPHGHRFSINLMNGHSTDDDIALHFNPRIGERQIVMNSKLGGNWGAEERVELPPVFANRQPFEVKIVAKRNKFKIFVNRRPVWIYRARGNVEDIKGVNVRGDADVFLVNVHRKLEKPVCETLPGGLREDGWVIVQGIPKKNSDRFALNLRCGEGDDSDIAFHFNPRFTEGCTVRNSKINGHWGGEERDAPGFPFEQKELFEIAINNQKDRFVTFVNGRHFINYNHRLPVDSVRCLQLDGNADFFEPEVMY